MAPATRDLPRFLRLAVALCFALGSTAGVGTRRDHRVVLGPPAEHRRADDDRDDRIASRRVRGDVVDAGTPPDDFRGRGLDAAEGSSRTVLAVARESSSSMRTGTGGGGDGGGLRGGTTASSSLGGRNDDNDEDAEQRRRAEVPIVTKWKKKKRRRPPAPVWTRYSTIEGFPCYRDVAGTARFISDLADRASSSASPSLNVTLRDIGDSYLKSQNESIGHDIWALSITGGGATTNGASTEKGVLLATFGLHAREMASPELGMRFAEALEDGYGTDADLTATLDRTEIHLILQSNPDGREADEARQNKRRKNLNPTWGDASDCGEDKYGVDLNRNFPFMWGLDSGSSNNPCSQTYRGAAPASEPEVRAIVDYATGLFPAWQRKDKPELDRGEPYPENATGIFIDVHSHGEVIIIPWGHELVTSPNAEGLEALARKLTNFNGYALSSPDHGKSYKVSGGSYDWAYGALGVAGMVFELGTEFYQDCEYFDDHVVPGNLEALLFAAKASRLPYSVPKGPDVIDITLSPWMIPNKETVTMSVSAEASDSLFSSDKFTTSQQVIASVLLFVDVHPYDTDLQGNFPEGREMLGQETSGTATASATLSGSDILSVVSEPIVGRHFLSVQATDSDGYAGPVTTVFFDVVQANGLRK